MKAEEVRRRYAAGDRDFSKANLRGQNFRGQDLGGADFSGKDIRGADFTNAILRGANFNEAKVGVQKRWVVFQIVTAFWLSILLSYNSFFLSAVFTTTLLPTEALNQFTILPGLIILCISIAVFSTIARQGLTIEAMGSLIIAVAVIVALAGLGKGSPLTVAIGTIAVAVAIVVAIAGAVAGVATKVGTFLGAVLGIVGVTSIDPVELAGAGAEASASASAVTGAVAVAVAVLLLSFYIDQRVYDEDKNFALVRIITKAFSAIGGTNFHNADLTDANFNGATLKSTNFNGATLTRTCWTNAKRLDRARVGNSILSNAKVRELLVTGNGYNKDYEDCNLRGANLTGANLNKAKLKRADLGEATLHKTDLREANLTEVQALETDFTEAALTGACLEGWNIDDTTKLDRVDCQYVFLLEKPNAMGNRERRPHHPDQVFQSGEFEKLYKKMINVVQILLRDGINQEAFREAFQKLMEEHPDISFASLQGIEKKGRDVLVTLELGQTADKAKIEQDFLKPYEQRLKQLEAENEQLKLRSADLKDIAIALANKPTQITQLVGDGKVNDQSQNFNVGGNFNATNSVVGLREISGNVTNAINQLSDAPAGGANLKELLLQLQAVLENADEAVLPETDKADALEAVELLAEAAQKPDEEKKTIASKAMRSLQRIVNAIPTAVPMATTLVTEFNKLVPAIATLLGL